MIGGEYDHPVLPLRVLGYDLRIACAPLSDVPASVDSLAWRSIAELDECALDQGFHGLWASLESLLAHAPPSEPLGSSIITCIIRLSPVLDAIEPGWQFYAAKVGQPSSVHPVKPRFVTGEWEFAGYDVADYYLWSALHTPETELGLLELAASWQRNPLTPFLLLRDYEVSSRLAIETEKLYGGRAPFFVYGVFTRAF